MMKFDRDSFASGIMESNGEIGLPCKSLKQLPQYCLLCPD
jgi:hypothetical protein